jgi:DNA replication protein DnaC
MPAIKETESGTREGFTRCDCYKQKRIPRLLEQAGIPSHYETATIANFLTPPNSPSIQNAKNIAEHFVQEYPAVGQQGLLFMGRPGRGKTHLAIRKRS